jgi:hypothetical protein
MNYPVVNNADELIEFAELARDTDRILALYGQGGVGKTSVCEDIVAPALNIADSHVFVVNHSGSAPSEVKGTGVPDMTTREMWFGKPTDFPLYERIGDEPALLVLDEYPEWDASVQSLCRSLFQPTGSRPKIGSHELSANTVICVTGNRRIDGSRSSVPSAPFVERCVSIVWQPTLDQWLDWAAAEGLAASPVYTFLKFNGLDQRGREGDFFCPPVPQPWTGDAHPCPRQWAAACLIKEDSRILQKALASLVGDTAAAAAYAFHKTVAQILPKLAAVRAGTESAPTDPAEQFALVHCALRQGKRENEADLEAAVAGGQLDWLVDLLCNCNAEIREWGYRTATSKHCGIPLNQHSRRSAMQGVA